MGPCPLSPACAANRTTFDSLDISTRGTIAVMKEMGAHPNVIGIIGHCLMEQPYILLVELAELGNLRDFLREARATKTRPQQLSVAQMAEFCLQIASGMAFLESKSIVHRDLAARNVLVGKKLHCKISDFGCASVARAGDAVEVVACRVAHGVCSGCAYSGPQPGRRGQASVVLAVWLLHRLMVLTLRGSCVQEYRTTSTKLPIKWMAPESIQDRIYTVKADGRRHRITAPMLSALLRALADLCFTCAQCGRMGSPCGRSSRWAPHPTGYVRPPGAPRPPGVKGQRPGPISGPFAAA